MAGKNEIKASVRLEGGSTFKKDITDVNKNLKQLDAESKKVAAEFDGQANSLQALTAKQKVLNQTLEEAQRKVQLYDSRIKDLESQQRSISEATEKYRSELKDAQAALSHMDKGTDAYRDQAAAVEDLSRKVALGEKNQERAAGQIQKYRTEQTQAQTAVAKLNREIDDNAKYLKEAESASDQCATSIDEYGHKVKDASERSKDLGDVAKVALGNLAADAASKLADAAVDAAKAMVEVGSNFEAAMSEVEAISGASGSNLDAMSAKAKELGSTTKFTATDVANGFKYMSLAGWDTAQMLSAIDGVVNLAAASDMDLAQASDMVTDYLSAFGLQASDSAKMVDEMVFAQSHSNTSTKQLGEAFGNCAANMNAAGQSMETTVAVLEAMANQGTKGSQAGTQLAAVMRDITSKMKNGAIQIGKTSVQVKDSEGNYRDLVDILSDVEAATEGMGSADKAAALQKTFTARSIKAVNQVLNEGAGKIRGYRDALEDSNGAAAKTASTMMDNFKGAMTEASSAAEGLGVALFEKVSKPMTGVVDGATAVMGALTDALTPPPKSELQTFIDDVARSIEDTQYALDNISGAKLTVETNVSEIEAYRTVLQKATDAEKLNEVEKYQVKAAVDALGGSIPQLSDAYDEETGKINLTKEAVDQLIDSYENQYKMQAYADMMTDAYRAQAEAGVEVQKAADAYDAAKQKALDYGLTQSNIVSLTNNQTESVADLAYNLSQVMDISQEEAREIITELQSSNKAYMDAGKAKKAANDEVTRLEGEVEKLTRAEEENSEAADGNAESTKDFAGATKTALKAGTEFLTGFLKKAVPAAEDVTDAVEDETEAVEEDTEATEENTEAKSKAQEAGEKFAGTMQKVGEKVLEAAERQKEASEKEKTALQSVREAYESNYNSIKTTLSQKLSLWNAFDGGEDITVEQMLENLRSQTAGITQYKQEMEAVIAEYGDELGPDLIHTLQEMGSDAANTWHHMFVTMSQDNAPELFAEMGQQWAEGLDLADQIAKYCAGNLTAFEMATGQLGSTKIEWTGLRESVQDMTPELEAAIDACEKAGVAIPDGLAKGIESGEMSTLDAAALLTGSLKGTFDGLYEIAEQSGVEIPEGLSKGMEGSADEYEAAIGQLTEALSSAGSDAGTAAAESIGTAMTDSSDTVETAAEDTAGAAADAAEGKKSDFKTAGSTAATQYASGVTSQKAQATSAGRLLGQAAKTGVESKKGSFQSVGTNMAAALAAGIRAGESQAISAAVHMAVEAYKRAKDAIGQKSPTGVFKDELGANIPLAVARGITEHQQGAELAAARMARSTFDAARYGVMAERMNSDMPVMTAPSVNVDTTPIAQMIGSAGGASIVNYFTISSAKDPEAFAATLARELKQQLKRA